MMVHVKLFAAIRDAAGVDSLDLQACSVAEVAQQLGGRYPAAKLLLARSRFAVNQSFATPEMTLNDRDEVAVIPPVSGG